MTSAAFQRHSLVGLLMLTACGGSKTPAPGQNAELTVGEDTASDDPSAAGGESSEFGGTRIYCEAFSRTPLDREDEDVAPWVAMAEGQYEVGFNWQRLFLTDAVTGFQEDTRASFDVRVLAAYDVVFDEFCPGDRSLQLEVEVAIETADGAMSGTFIHSVATEPGSGPTRGESLRTYWPEDVAPTPLDDFSGSLDYGVDLEPMARRDLSVQLSLDGTSIYGWLTPFLSPQSNLTGGGYTPILGVFSDDGCTHTAGRPLSLDARVSGFVEETPRALYERAIASWQAGPIAAAWSDGSTTELGLSAGEPLRVCHAGTHVSSMAALIIDVPVRLESSDGRVALDHTPAIIFGAGETSARATTTWRRPWIPVDQFEPMTGIQGVNFGSAEFGGVALWGDFNLAANTSTGLLAIDQWDDIDSSSGADYPLLSW